MAPPSAPPTATPFKPHNGGADGDEALPEGALGEPDLDEDDLENSMSLAAIEAELKPKVLETFDTIANSFKRLRDRKSTRLNSSHWITSRMPSSA